MSMKAVAGVACTIGGAACVIGTGVEGLRYSSWGDPGAMTVCVALFWAALAQLAVPAVMIVVWFVREARRYARQVNLSPWVEVAAMEVLHHEWSKANSEWSARLTDSVMGPAERKQW